MILSFHLEYYTRWGEEIRVVGSLPELGNGHLSEALILQTVDGVNWSAEIQVEQPDTDSFTYTYCLCRDSACLRREWQGLRRTIYLGDNPQKEFCLYDKWRDKPTEAHLFSSAFTDVWLRRTDPLPVRKPYTCGLRLKLHAPRIPEPYTIAVCGNQSILGNWEWSETNQLSDAGFPEWEIAWDATQFTYPIEYKYVLYNKETRCIERWEAGANRRIEELAIRDYETLVREDCPPDFGLPLWYAAGTAIPVFSLRSERSFGIGDFGDLKQMIDWVALTGQKVLQLLPVCDTTAKRRWEDSYPYNCISVYALHPLYLDMRQLGTIDSAITCKRYAQLQRALNNNSLEESDNSPAHSNNSLAHFNNSPEEHYKEVATHKWEYFRRIYQQEGASCLALEDFQAFVRDNADWLEPYAAFCFLRDRYHTVNFTHWEEYAVYTTDAVRRLCDPNGTYYKEIAFHYYLQYHLHKQLKAASLYAHSKGVVLKGDIPIGVSRYSVETWTKPAYFDVEHQVGAPPDAFSENGQEWGFPVYNWNEMAKDGYSWWVKRLRKMSEYFDAYRIDHILGFFRIWQMPRSKAKRGCHGYFMPALPLSMPEIRKYGIRFLPSLFLSDWKEHGKFHPRIDMHRIPAYNHLSTVQKRAYDALYDDYFYRRHTEFWKENAMRQLPALIDATRMLPCGEDLGMIPAGVSEVMNELQILSLEIQRMPKEFGNTFGDTSRYPYRSVCMLSTHDMSTLRGWWEEDKDLAARYYGEVLGRKDKAPKTATPALCEEIVKLHLQSSSMLTILLLQDWLSIEESVRRSEVGFNVENERINNPAITPYCWSWRMPMTIEELLSNKSLNEHIKRLVQRDQTKLE
ncbi:MAG: 4-alpha-glucanotransferase [Prevotellaceae bacterium]|jgi:4-alpha-glucanotransferase|nr:4-alpha-glucanotransferase [Prevotellaceae bacterium]